MENKDTVIIIDYQLGNLFSIKHALLKVGVNPLVTSDKNVLMKAKAIILPGVGAFENAMKSLRKLDLIAPLKDKVQDGTPLLGICLGLQLLFDESEENGIHKGLGLIQGVVKKFPQATKNKRIKVPNIGWNKIYSHDNGKWSNTPLYNIKQNEFMYFVHSYYVVPDDDSDVLSLTNYEGIEYCSSIKKDNIIAFQFHPEKSGLNGLKIYKNIKKLML